MGRRFPYRAVVFDLDDTLVKTKALKWQQHKAVAKRYYDFDLTDEVIAEHWGKPLDDLIRALYGDADTLDNMKAAYKTLSHLYPKELHDDALPMISHLLDQKIHVGVLTSTNRDFALNDMTRLGFPIEKFIAIQGADDYHLHKPDPGVFEPMLIKLSAHGVAREDVTYVGDALMDYFAARDAGLGFVGVTSGVTPEEEFRKHGADVLVNRLGEIVRVLSVTV